MDNFEVYVGYNGVWERVVLVGSESGNQAILKSAVDSLRPVISEVSSITAILRKVATDTVQTGVNDISELISSGVSERVGLETLVPRFTETTAVFVKATSSETVRVGIADVASLVMFDDTGELASFETLEFESVDFE